MSPFVHPLGHCSSELLTALSHLTRLPLVQSRGATIPEPMRTLPLPGTPYDTNFFNRRCVFLTDDPWTVMAWSLDDGGSGAKQSRGRGSPCNEGRSPASVTDEGAIWVSRDQQLVRVDSGEVVEVGTFISRFICLADGFLVALHEDGSSITDVVSVARSTRTAESCGGRCSKYLLSSHR